MSNLKVITKNPVVYTSNEEETKDYYSTFIRPPAVRRAKKASRQNKRAVKRSQGTSFGQRLGQGLKKVADSGIVQNLLSRVGAGAGAGAGAADLPPSPPEKKGMSTGAKVGIGLAIVAVIGVGAYFMIKKK